MSETTRLLILSTGDGHGQMLIAVVDGAGSGAAERLIRDGARLIADVPYDETTLTVTLADMHDRVRDERTLVAGADAAHEARVRDHTDQDFLTGLSSRQAAITWLDQALAGGDVSACLLLGISQFDSINAAYGQMVGDALLARAAGRIAQVIDEANLVDSLVARVGGTEFLVALRGGRDPPDSDRALILARQIHAAVARPFVAGDHLIRVTTRCGIAEALAGDDSARMMRRAAAALADARRSGVGDICLRSADKRGRGFDPERLDADLRLALERGEIGIMYQPQYDCANDSIVGVEALARWNHAQFGQLGAGVLFDAAERSDYLLPLSRHIQREALRQAGAWPASLSALRLSINVTAADLAQPDFVPYLLGMVDEAGFPRDRLTVEITESGLIENLRFAGDAVRQLRDADMLVAIDDFGTGYSSLAYLKALHPDYLKIDSGLTRDIAGAPRDRIIVRGIIAMAKSLSLTVIAEGVENETELALLSREGCDLYQGFLRSAALDNAALIDLMQRQA
ncbi:MAG: bifunctional diguanylate cyclase/phosphodiesterase [Sphingobium sp.]